jgi:hypothetical protein
MDIYFLHGPEIVMKKNNHRFPRSQEKKLVECYVVHADLFFLVRRQGVAGPGLVRDDGDRQIHPMVHPPRWAMGVIIQSARHIFT